MILSTGGCLPQCMLGCPPPGSRHPPGADPPKEQTPPWEQTPPQGADTPSRSRPLGSRHPPGADTPRSTPHSGSRLRHTVNERPVRHPTGMHSCCVTILERLINVWDTIVFFNMSLLVSKLRSIFLQNVRMTVI